MRIEMRSNAPAFGCNGACYAESYCKDVQSMLGKGLQKLGKPVDDQEILEAVQKKLECTGNGTAPCQSVKKLYTQVFHDNNWARILFENNNPLASKITAAPKPVVSDNVANTGNQLNLFA